MPKANHPPSPGTGRGGSPGRSAPAPRSPIQPPGHQGARFRPAFRHLRPRPGPLSNAGGGAAGPAAQGPACPGEASPGRRFNRYPRGRLPPSSPSLTRCARPRRAAPAAAASPAGRGSRAARRLRRAPSSPGRGGARCHPRPEAGLRRRRALGRPPGGRRRGRGPPGAAAARPGPAPAPGAAPSRPRTPCADPPVPAAREPPQPRDSLGLRHLLPPRASPRPAQPPQRPAGPSR